MEKFSISNRIVYTTLKSSIIKQALQAINRGYETYFIRCNGKFKLVHHKYPKKGGLTNDNTTTSIDKRHFD